MGALPFSPHPASQWEVKSQGACGNIPVFSLHHCPGSRHTTENQFLPQRSSANWGPQEKLVHTSQDGQGWGMCQVVWDSPQLSTPDGLTSCWGSSSAPSSGLTSYPEARGARGKGGPGSPASLQDFWPLLWPCHPLWLQVSGKSKRLQLTKAASLRSHVAFTLCGWGCSERWAHSKTSASDLA